MLTSMTGPSIRLASLVLGEDLQDWVVRTRAAGASWLATAAELAATTGGQVALSGEYLRQLYGAVAPTPAAGEESNGGEAA